MPLLRQIKPILTRLTDTYKDLSLLEDIIIKWDTVLRVGLFVVLSALNAFPNYYSSHSGATVIQRQGAYTEPRWAWSICALKTT